MNKEDLIPVDEKLRIALAARFPDIKPLLVKRYVDKYVAEVMKHIAENIINPWTGNWNNEFTWPRDTINRACGRDAKSKYIYDIMQEDNSTSLVIETFKGNKGKYSRAIYNPLYKKDIMDYLGSMVVELDPTRLKQLDEESNNSVIVDPLALDSFIRQTKESLNGWLPSEKYREALVRNLQVAQQLIQMIKTDDVEYWLDEKWTQTDAGRIYGLGLSLQRIPKDVRHAALGECHKYDFKAASIAIMTGVAVKINPSLKIAALTDYIKYRSVQRARIAKDIGVSEERIKQVFTSIGFGAEIKDNPFSAVRGLLGQDAYDKLIANTEFRMFKTQLEEVSKTIHKHYPNAGFELCGRTYNPIDPSDGTKRTKNQKLAWIYQCFESHALSLFTGAVKSQDAILHTHDCLYFKKKLPLSDMQNAAYALQKSYPLLQFEHEAIFPIHHNKDVKVDNAVQQIDDHKQRMAQQELAAQGYTSSYAIISPDSNKKKQVMTPWGLVDADLIQQEQTSEYFTEQYYKD
jgi:hypothetical protein